MIKKASRRFLVLTLVLVLLMSLMPTGFAADGLTVEGLGATTSGEGWTLDGNTAKGTLSVTGGCNDAASAESTLTLKNNLSTPATLTFNYVPQGSTVTINGNVVNAAGSFSDEIPAGDTVTITMAVTAEQNETANCSVELTAINLLVDKEITVQFAAAENGSYTADGNAAPYTFTGSSLKGHAVNATAASGYQFFGWYNDTAQKYVSNNANDTLYFTDDATIHPVFVSASLAFFQVGSTMFFDLNDAVAFANSTGANLIVLAKTGTLPTGSYTIPNGKTLLIPFDSANTVYRETPQLASGDHVTPTAFRTMTMASGASITVERGGAISVPSKYSAVGTGSGSWNGTPSGPYGHIEMSDGSSITLQNGSALYCFGYISGTGNVTAQSGSTVWEYFQLRCWRGGSATTSSNMTSKGVFPMNQYYVQNIEAYLTLEAGATEKVYTAVNGGGQQPTASATFIGTGGMFILSNGSITKHYDGAADRLIIDVNGDMSIESLALKISALGMNIDLDTANFDLPINSNITVNIHSGTTGVSQNVAFLPGAALTIDDGANVNIKSSSKVYVYDKDEWGNYAAAGLQLVPVGYSVANGTTAKRDANSLVDAKIVINGTLSVSGEFYTTAHGAEIISNGTGKVVLNAAAGTDSTTKMATQSGTNTTIVNIPITAAQLKNADGSFTQSKDYKKGDTIPYVGGKWGGDTVLITFVANDGTGASAGQRAKLSTDTALDANAFTRAGYDFTGWNTAADGTGTAYADGATVNLAADLTLFAQWQCRHEQTELRGVVEATCTEPGYSGDTYCKTCGIKLADGTATEALGHDWNDGEITTAPTCEGAGVKTFTCSRCGETYTEAVDATGHTPKAVEKLEPTCTEPGHEAGEVCEVCGAVLSGMEEIPALGHTPVTDAAVAPTCTETGLTEGSHCSRCGEVLVAQETVPALGHTPVVDEAVAPTCTATGLTEGSHCAVCGEVLVAQQVVDKLPHTPVTDPAVNATCTETGLTEGSHCSVCGEVLVAQEVVPAKGHTEEIRGYVAPTLTKPGYTGDKYCSVCDELLEQGQVIPRTGAEVTWIVDGEETVVTLPIGEVPAFDGTPAKAETLTATYTFTGWTPEVTALTADGAAYTAVFEENVKSGWIAWEDSFYYIENGEPVKGVAYVPYPTEAPAGYGPREADLSNETYPDAEKSLFVFDETTGAFLPETNGLFEYDGATVWAVNGELPWYVGLVKDGENYHFFAPGREMVKNKDYWCHRLNGVKFDIDGAEVAPVQGGRYTFDADGNLMKLRGVVDLNGAKYFYNNYCKDKLGLFEYNGDYYYAKSNSELVYGRDFWVSNTNGLVEEGKYTFDADGKMVLPDTTKNGFVEEDGVMHYYVDGEMQKDKGLVEINGAYYYIRWTGEVVRNRTFWVTNHNGIVKEGKYVFDADGKIQLPDTTKNGFVEEDGVMHYYVDGEMQKDKGLIEINGAYYYIRWTGEVVRGRTFWVTNHHDIVPEGKYVFNADGTMVMP